MRTLTYDVPSGDDGRQIKYVIRSRLGISHRQLGRLKGCDGMRVNGEAVHANRVVRTGDRIELLLEYDGGPLEYNAGPAQPDASGPADRQPSQCVPESEPEDERELIARLSPSGGARTRLELAEEIIAYEDADLLIVDKPAPLPTGASAHKGGLTLEALLCARYGRAWQFRPVNRLDKGTSGLMALAHTAHAHHLMQQQLHTPEFRRIYRAVTQGAPAPERGRIALPIARAPGSAVKRCVAAQGKPCVTHYRTLWSGGGRALVELELDTGRTHQIRVHLAALGCPVYGDFLYGIEDPERLPGRFALHSHALSCVQPVTQARLSFVSALPDALARLLTGYVNDDNSVPNLDS